MCPIIWLLRIFLFNREIMKVFSKLHSRVRIEFVYCHTLSLSKSSIIQEDEMSFIRWLLVNTSWLILTITSFPYAHKTSV